MSTYHITILAAALFLLASCGQQTEQTGYDFSGQEEPFDQYSADNEAVNTEETGMRHEAPAGKGRKQNFRIVERNTNMPMWSISLPESWTFDYNLDYSKNPDYPATDWRASDRRSATRVQNNRSEIYTYSADKMAQQSLQMAGMKNTPPAGIQGVQQRLVAKTMASKGYQKVSEAPSKAHVQRSYEAARAFGINGLGAEAITTEWEGAGGKKAQTILVYASIQQQGMTTWWYEWVVMEGEGKGFAKAADEMNAAILAVQDNPAWIRHTNQVAARKNAARQQQAQQSFQAHQQRMANNQRSFEASQRAINSANEAVNNSIMSTYETQSRSSDRTQSQFVDYLRDEQNVYNSNDGNAYKVESGYNQYYMNNNGEYIGSNNSLYDPNLDPTINNQNWTETDPY